MDLKERSETQGPRYFPCMSILPLASLLYSFLKIAMIVAKTAVMLKSLPARQRPCNFLRQIVIDCVNDEGAHSRMSIMSPVIRKIKPLVLGPAEWPVRIQSGPLCFAKKWGLAFLN